MTTYFNQKGWNLVQMSIFCSRTTLISMVFAKNASNTVENVKFFKKKLVTRMIFHPVGCHCDHIGPLITTKFGLKVAQARANNFYYWFSGPRVHFEGNNKLNRPKSAKKCLGRTCFGDSCGLIYNPNSPNLVSNRRWLKKKQIPFSPLLSETISGCPKFELSPKIENLRLLCTKITT